MAFIIDFFYLLAKYPLSHAEKIIKDWLAQGIIQCLVIDGKPCAFIKSTPRVNMDPEVPLM